MENNIQLISIAEILDGRTFYIPSYQRGYRWTTKEVTDLLNDLYSFTIRGKKNDGEFYCLQPIIVQRIEDETIIKRQTIEDNTTHLLGIYLGSPCQPLANPLPSMRSWLRNHDENSLKTQTKAEK